MKLLIKNTIGNGKTSLVFLHGWGFNSKIWNGILTKLIPYFKIHLIDLPGFGKNYKYDYMNIDEMVFHIYEKITEKSIWIGWSLGGIIAQKIALTYPNNVISIVTVCSSPCFIQKKNWPGIKKEKLNEFHNKMQSSFSKTIKNFFLTQIPHSISTIKIKKLINEILLEKKPTNQALQSSLNILNKIDLRNEIKKSSVPLLRIYGKFDAIVPYTVKNILDKDWPNTKSLILDKSAHIPFISQSRLFCKVLINFSK